MFGNIGTVISFRVGTNDAEFLAKYFAPVFDSSDLQRVPNHNAIVRMLIGGVPSQPFSMAGLPPLGNENKQLFGALKQLSAAKYGRPRAEIEAEIFERLKVNEPPSRPPAFGAGAPNAFGGQPGMPMANSPYGNPPAGGAYGASPAAQAAAKPASFLDDWLSKRNNQPARPITTPQPFGSAPAAPVTPAYPAFQPSQPAVAMQPTPATVPPVMPTPSVNPAFAPSTVSVPATDPANYPTISAAVPSMDASSPLHSPLLHKQEPAPTPAAAVANLTHQAPRPSADTSGAAYETKNITSNELEEQDIEQIAHQLKQGLDDQKAAAAKGDHLETGDTIYIDQEGNMTSNGDQTASGGSTTVTEAKA